jgi:hypothetical protein
MQHNPTPGQISGAVAESGRTVVELTEKKLLIVPDDPTLGRDWFVQRAEEIAAAIGGISEGDILHVMGQQQLAMAVAAIGRKAGAMLVESVTPRVSIEVTQPDGSVKKENVFTFSGFRTVHEY